MSKYLNEDGLVKLISLIKKADQDVESKITNYTLPIASADTLGGIKIGNSLSVDDSGTVIVVTTSIYSATSTEPANGVAIKQALDTIVIETSDDGNITIQKN